MTYIFVAFYFFWAGALGEYLSRKYPESSIAWVLFWSAAWPVRVAMLALKLTGTVAK